MSRAFDAYLYLADPDGQVLAQDDDGGGNLNSRIVYLADQRGTYYLIATSLGGNGLGPFSISARVLYGSGAAQQGLPSWFRALDTDGDGQVSLREWLQGGKRLGDFRKYDLNDDGFITPDEVLQGGRGATRLELEDGRASHQGALGKPTSERYLGKQAFKVFAVKLERGKTYQIELVSPAYFAYLYLEDPDGEILGKHDSGGRGRAARIVCRAAWTGTYRVIATSQGGFRTGAFALSVRVLHGSFGSEVAEDLPPWFHDLDTDQDGQISLPEWRAGGKKLDEFRKYDRNGDGVLTAEEVLWKTRQWVELRFERGQALYQGALVAADLKYRGKKVSKVFAVKLEAGSIYQFDHMSRAFDAYLYLADPDGQVLAQDDDGGGNLNSRIVYRAAQRGTYFLIATSLGGNGLGPFALSARVLNGSGVLLEGLPPWFHDLDTDGDGQVSFCEWKQGGKELSDFREYDLNDDGFITASEVRRHKHHNSKHGGVLPKGIPPWFKQLDTDGDGQVSLSEWRQGGKQLNDFREYDLNDDGFITMEEMRRYVRSHANRPKRGSGLK
jgi:Ca2+-binding EF-hand superfamily protein